MTQPPLWLLDIDGVINAVGRSYARPWPLYRSGQASPYSELDPDDRGYTITWAPALTEQIRELHESGAVEVQWLTTWGSGANIQLADLVGLPKFEVVEEPNARSGKLDRFAWWKFEAAKDVATANPGRKVIWTDDDLWSEPLAKNFARDNGWLAIAPHVQHGLAPAHLELILTYIEYDKESVA